MKKLITIVFIALMASCASNKSIVDYCPAYALHNDTTQTDSLAWIEYNGVDCENCDEIN